MQPVSRPSLPISQALGASTLTSGVEASADTLNTASVTNESKTATRAGADSADIADDLLGRAQNDHRVLKFARAASRIEDTATANRAAELKQQLATPDGLQAYLNKISTESIASSMLQSPVASYLAVNS